MMNTYTILYPISFTDHGNFTAKVGDYCVHNEETLTLTIYRENNIVATIKPMRTGAMQAMCGHKWMTLNPVEAGEVKVAVLDSGDIAIESTPESQDTSQEDLAASVDESEEPESTFVEDQLKKSLGGLDAENLGVLLGDDVTDDSSESSEEVGDGEEYEEVEEEDDQGTSVYPAAPRAVAPKKKVVKKKRGRKPGSK